MSARTKKALSGEEVRKQWPAVCGIARELTGVTVTSAGLDRLELDEAGVLVGFADRIWSAANYSPPRATELMPGVKDFIGRVEAGRDRAKAKANSSAVRRSSELLVALAREENRTPTRAQMDAIGDAVSDGAVTLADARKVSPVLRRTPAQAARFEPTFDVLLKDEVVTFKTLVEKAAGLEPGWFEQRREKAALNAEIKDLLAGPVVLPAAVFRDLAARRLWLMDVLYLTLTIACFDVGDIDETNTTLRDGALVSRGGLPWPRSWYWGQQGALMPTGSDTKHPLNRLTRQRWLAASYDVASRSWTIRKGPKLAPPAKARPKTKVAA